MKKILSVLVMALSFSTVHATSVLPSILEFSRQPKAVGGKTTSVDLYRGGMVVYREAAPYPGGLTSKKIATLPDRQVDKIDRLVRASVPPRIKFRPSTAMCFAPASHIDVYTASMGRIPLKKGAVCDGGFRVNVKAAAVTLVDVLEVLFQGAANNQTESEIIDEVDSILY